MASVAATPVSATASSTYSSNAPSRLYDNDLWIYWQSAEDANGAWVYLDFGSTIDAEGFGIFFNSKTYNWSTTYKIQGSNNASDWTDLKTVSHGGGGWDEYAFSSTASYRYFRLLGVSGSGGSWGVVGELTIYTTYDPEYPLVFAYRPVDTSDSAAAVTTTVTDGDLNTRIQSRTNASNGPWLLWDYGESFALSSVTIKQDGITALQIQYTDDREGSWTTAHTVADSSGDKGSEVTYNFTEATGRYWRILPTAGGDWPQWYELTVDEPVEGPEQTVPAEQYWPPDGIFRFQVELGLATQTGTDVWDTGLWGTATWAATSPVYVDVTEHVLGFTCKYGRTRFDERMKTGNARITFDNSEGWFNPDAGEDFDASLALRPGRWIRLSAVRDTDNAQWDLWEGYVYSIEERYTNGGSDSITVVDAFDFAGLMAQHDEPAQSAAGSGELSGARVHRVLDEFGPVDGGWPWRDVAGGLHTMQSTTLAQNLLEEAQRAADADNGAFFFRNRYATFRPFDWLTNQEYERSQEVQLYPGRGSTGDPEIIDAETEWTAQVIRNDVQMSRDGGSAQRSQDTTSQGIYGRHSWHRLDLQNDTDADVSDIADAILAAYAYDYQRLKAVTIVPTTGTTTPDLLAVTAMLDMRLGDLVSVDVDLGPRGWSYTTEAHVMGIQFDVAPAFWSMTLRLDQSVRGNPEESS